ncbi:MAG: alpha/beta hydrolase [Rhodospirillaceae bacterium]
MNLEVLHARPAGDALEANDNRPPLLFVHGAFVGAWCWAEHFMAWFAKRGWHCCALSLRGHGESEGRKGLDRFSLADYGQDVLTVANSLGRPPVLVGHSMGGPVSLKALELAGGGFRHKPLPAVGLALMCSPSPLGLAGSNLRMATRYPNLYWSLVRLQTMGPQAASPNVLVKAMFANPPDPKTLGRYYGQLQAESSRAAMDLSGFGLPRPTLPAGFPIHVMGTSVDPFVAEEETKLSAQLLKGSHETLDDIGHAVMLDGGWERAATSLQNWLIQQEFAPAAVA